MTTSGGHEVQFGAAGSHTSEGSPTPLNANAASRGGVTAEGKMCRVVRIYGSFDSVERIGIEPTTSCLQSKSGGHWSPGPPCPFAR